jgi:hypothetical protein
MDMEEEINKEQAQTDIEEENPLLFWTAYMEGTDGKRHYLGNGNGGHRMFRRRYGKGGLEEYLDQNVDPARRHLAIVHNVQGKIDVPVDEKTLQEIQNGPTHLRPVANVMDRLLIDIPPIPISTLSRETLPPNAIDLLEEELKRKKRRKRK